MQKFLRTLALMAFMVMPWAVNAQNTLTVADGTATNSNVPIHGLWSDAYLRCQTIYPAAMLEEAADAIGMNGGTISSLTYYLSSTASAAYTGTWEIKMTEVSASTLSGWQNVSGATTVYTGTLDATASPLVITFTTPYTYNGGNLLIEVNQIESGNYKSASYYGVSATGASWQGYNSSAWTSITGSAQNFIPKTTFTFTGGQPITCRSVSDLVTSNITSNSVDLTWADLNNTGATYSIYNGEQLLGTVAAGVYSYSVTGLEGNTEYTLSVVANCSESDASAAKSVTFRTDCDIISSLPWTEGFENVPSGSYQMPYCWSKVSTNNYPYSYNSNYRSGSRALYFYATTSSPDYLIAVLPELDVTTYPMNGNMISFWARTNTSSYTTYADATVQIGSMSDPTDASTFVVDSTIVIAPTATYSYYCIKLNKNSLATNAYAAIRLVKPSSSYCYLYIDDLVLDQMPSCWPVTDLTVDATTENSVTLSWNDADNVDGITYSVTYGDQTVSGLTSPATITGLTANTAYTFNVVANCAANDASNAVSISTRTLCDQSTPLTLPFTMGFEENEEDIYCWSAIYADENPSVNTMGIIEESGSRMWRFSSYSSSSDYNQYLATPVFASTEPVKVKFSHKAYGSYNDQIRVLYTTTESGDELLEATDWMRSETLTTDSIYLPATANRVIFHYYGSYLYYYYIDNIVVDVAPTHTVSFNYLTTDPGVTVGSAVAANAATYEGDSVLLTSTPATNMRTAGWYPGNLTSVEGVEAIAVDTNDLEILVTSDTTITVVYGYGQFEIKGITANEN